MRIVEERDGAPMGGGRNKRKWLMQCELTSLKDPFWQAAIVSRYYIGSSGLFV